MEKIVKVLMIEDDLEIAELLEEYLLRYNIELDNCETPQQGILKLQPKKYDLLIKRASYAVSRQELLTNVESIKYESSYKSIDVLSFFMDVIWAFGQLKIQKCSKQ